jgi:hypothetical protein
MPYRRPQANSRPSNSLFEQSPMPPLIRLVMLVANGSRDEPLPRAKSPNTQWWYLDSQHT